TLGSKDLEKHIRVYATADATAGNGSPVRTAAGEAVPGIAPCSQAVALNGPRAPEDLSARAEIHIDRDAQPIGSRTQFTARGQRNRGVRGRHRGRDCGIAACGRRTW